MSKIYSFFIVFYVFGLPILQGQPITFNRLLDTSLALRCASATPDNGFVLAGVPDYECMYAMRIDSAGSFVWDHTFTERGLSSYNCTIVGKDGSIWAYGEAYDRPIPRLVPHIVKYSPNGRVLWHKAYRTNADNLEFRFSGSEKFIRLDDGSFAFTGSVTSDSLSSLGIRKGIVIRTDSNGNELWRYMFPYDTIFGFGAIGKTSQNDIIVLAVHRSQGFILFKFNKQGQLLWRNDSGLQTGNSNLFRIVGLPNGNILVSYARFVIIINDPRQGVSIPEYAFFDSMGNLQYTRQYIMQRFTPHLYSSGIFNLVLNQDSTALMAYGNIDFPLDLDSNGLKDKTYFLRTNLAGDSLTSGFFRAPTTNASSRAIDIALAADNGYFLFGYAEYRPPSRVYDPRWLLKVDSLGRLNHRVAVEAPPSLPLPAWSVYPNPIHTTHYIKGDFANFLKESADIPLELLWVDVLGSIIKQQSVPISQIATTSFDVQHLARGTYFLLIRQGSRYLGAKKIILF